MPDFAYMAEQLWMMMADTRNSEIGMLHDGYLKLYQLSNPILDFDCVLLDEAQDTNPVTARIVLSQPCPKILVGDPHQQIYSFRGARDAMQRITAGRIMYLTYCFRFGSNIAILANQILECFKGEKQKLIGRNEEGVIGEVSVNHTFIARTNAAVFREAAMLYKQYKIGFVGGIDGYKLDEIVDTYYLYNNQRDRIRNSYIRSFQNYSYLKEFVRTVEDWELRSRCTIVEEYRDSIPQLVWDIKNAAVEVNDAQIVLTTVHKSKRLEFREVRIADDFPKLVNNNNLIPRESLNSDEFNSIYVAITRAKEKIMLSASLQEFIKIYMKLYNDYISSSVRF
jgi:F-box protein 18 (helicase)